MPVRIPKASRLELLTICVSGIVPFAPLYMMMPGATERVAAQTTCWAPRWERSISLLAGPLERGTHRLAPPVARAVRRLHARLPLLETAARSADRRIRRGIARAGWPAAAAAATAAVAAAPPPPPKE